MGKRYKMKMERKAGQKKGKSERDTYIRCQGQRGSCLGHLLPCQFPQFLAPGSEAGHRPRSSQASLWPTWLLSGASDAPLRGSLAALPGLPVAAPEPKLTRSLTFSCLRTSSCRWRKYWSLSCCFTSWCLSCR